MRRGLATLIGVVLAVVALAGPAVATWTGSTHAGSAGRAGALTMPAGATPTTSVDGNDVTVAWGATTTPPATGYTVRAFDALSGIERPTAGACSGIVAAVSCTEPGVPDGSWSYSVIPRLDNWIGVESARSQPATVETATPATTALVLTNVTGGTPGLIDPELDQLHVTFSEPLAVGSICSTWSNDATNQTLSGSDVVVTIDDNAGDNTLTVTASQCTLDVGVISLGADYLASPSATFSGSTTHASTVSWNVATRTLTIGLGQLASGARSSTPVDPAIAAYTPANALVDLAGNHVAATAFTAPAQRF